MGSSVGSSEGASVGSSGSVVTTFAVITMLFTRDCAVIEAITTASTGEANVTVTVELLAVAVAPDTVAIEFFIAVA